MLHFILTSEATSITAVTNLNMPDIGSNVKILGREYYKKFHLTVLSTTVIF